jgi:hypothetical protein
MLCCSEYTGSLGVFQKTCATVSRDVVMSKRMMRGPA